MLGVMNLLPIPALDGGHIVFCLYEMVTGRKPSDRVPHGGADCRDVAAAVADGTGFRKRHRTVDTVAAVTSMLRQTQRPQVQWPKVSGR